MEEKNLRYFINIVSQYFLSVTDKVPDVGSPYLSEISALPMLDYTGVIGISGDRQGCVYFTTKRNMLVELLMHIGETDYSDANLSDLAGEVANTISGNARRDFGPNFMISVPVIVEGRAKSIQVPKSVKAYILPIKWAKHEAFLVVSLQ